MVNFPNSLDAFANPSASTYTDDPGYELDEVISDLNDSSEALQGKVGVGATTPAANKTLIGAAGGVSGWDSISRRNLIRNGGFRLAQRAMPTTDNAYCLDGWRLLLEAANAATVAQETADFPTDGSNRGCRLTVGSGEDNKFGIWQVAEGQDVKHLRGKTVALQAKIKATAAITDVRMAVVEWTGTEDAVSADPVSAWNAANTPPTLIAGYAYLGGSTTNLSVTTAWATYRLQGLNVGASMTNLAVIVWCEDETTTVTTDIIRVTDVQLEEGALCTELERPPIQQELARCQRYYQKSWTPGTAVATASVNGAVVFGGSDNNTSKSIYAPVRHRVSMRTTPTVVLYDALGASAKITTINAAGATTDGVTPSSGAGFATAEGFTMTHVGTVAAVLFHYTADAEL